MNLEDLLNFLKQKLSITSLFIIAFIILILKGYNLWISLLAIGILVLLLTIFKLVSSCVAKEQKLIKLETIKAEIAKEFFEKYNPNLSKFFRILDEKKIITYKELENVLNNAKYKVFFVIESGERPINRRKTFFSRYVEENLGKNQNYEIFRLKISGTSSFAIFLENNGEINMKKFYEGYYDFVRRQVESSSDEKLKEWHKEKFSIDKPLILVTQPYVSSLMDLIEVISNKLTDKNRSLLNEKILNILSQKIKDKSRGIKLSYLFEAVAFNNEVIERVQKIEEKLVELLLKRYNIRSSENYFSELLSKKDFIINFEEALKNLDKEFLEKLKKDSRYNELKDLINDIQVKIYGVRKNE